MIERVIRHPEGRFLRCRRCNTQPRHVHSRGYSTRDPIVHIAGDSFRHRLECGCGLRTDRHATLALAEGDWNARHAQLSLPQPQRRRARA